MTDETKTPETGKEIQSIKRGHYYYDYVRADFARKLERERDEAKNLALELAKELYTSGHIQNNSNAAKLIKLAMDDKTKKTKP